MSQVALYEAKNRLSELVERVQSGEVIVITRRGKAVAQLALPPGTPLADPAALAAVERLRSARQGAALRGLKIRKLVAEGRR